MSQPILNIFSRALAYADSSTVSSPKRRFFDWQKDLSQIPVSNPQGLSISVPAGASQTLWNNQVTTSIDGTTAFTVTLSPLESNVYRITNVSGTSPAFRTNRNLTFSTHAVTFTQNPDSTVTLSVVGTTFGSTVAGDWLWVPGLTTGDPSTPISVLNQGMWLVVAVLSSTSVQLTRMPGQSFSAITETQTPASNAQLQTFSSAGVQIGNSVILSSGFSQVSLGTFVVSNVNPNWIEVTSGSPLALDVGVEPTASGMLFYSSAKRFVRIESDQALIVRVNGDTGSFNQILPFSAGDPELTGWYELRGAAFSLVVVNNSLVTANVDHFSVE